MPDVLEKTLQLQAGLKAWFDSDRYLHDSVPTKNPRLQKAFRTTGMPGLVPEKFGGVWSIQRAKKNPRHPASREALNIRRENWTGKTVTVEHAIPVNVLFTFFWDAETPDDMQAIIDAYAVAVVTKEEDERLNAAGLRETMPLGWWFGDDALARWNKANIEVCL